MRSMSVRRLNEDGISGMMKFLDSFCTETPCPLSDARRLLASAETSEALPKNVEVDAERVFDRRFDLARYLHERIPRTELDDADRDEGLWAWLALLWFDQLCPSKNGQRKPGASAQWIPQLDNARRSYRHRVFGPYVVYNAHAGDPARLNALLADPVHIATSEVYRSFVETTLVTCPAAVEVATRLYYDQSSGRLRRGAGVKGPGGARRLIAVLQQFDRTFDLHSLTCDDLLGLLPDEFVGVKTPTIHVVKSATSGVQT